MKHCAICKLKLSNATIAVPPLRGGSIGLSPALPSDRLDMLTLCHTFRLTLIPLCTYTQRKLIPLMEESCDMQPSTHNMYTHMLTRANTSWFKLNFN